MYVREIHIKSFRHLKDVHLGPFSHPPHQSDVVVLAGPNGGGKSSVLELLGYALSNSWSLGWSLRRTFPTNSFEVGIGVTAAERDLVRQFVLSSGAQSAGEVVSHLDNYGVYYRAYNYAEGEYQKNSNLYNRVHDLVTNALRNHYRRSLGFFLKSDRYYPAEAFRRERLFHHEEILKLDHIWSTAFNTSDVQYKDMFEFLLQQRYHYFRRLGAYHHRIARGVEVDGPPPTDPLQPYDELLQVLFPGYTFADPGEETPSDLFVRLPIGEIVPFSDLSSGEKEVFFIASFFLRHNVEHAVIVVDEPELHLHPEFARLLVRTMQNIRPGNQLWLATHNTEIMDEAGRDRVVFLVRDAETQEAVATNATDEAEAMKIVKSLFGYSGYVGIAKTIVFLEGIDSSSDRKIFTNLFPAYARKLKFVPSQSCENLSRINTAVLSILESNLGWMEFYMIRDRDYLPTANVTKLVQRHSKRLHVLDRFQIENYLLDDELIARVQTDIFGKPTTSEEVKNKFRSIARAMSGQVLREMVVYRLNLAYRPEDFSVGNFMSGDSIVGRDGELDSAKVGLLRDRLRSRVQEVSSDLQARTDAAGLDRLLTECQEEIRRALAAEDEWRAAFPGRTMIEKYAASEGLGKPPVFQNSLIKELALDPDAVPGELRHVIQTISEGERFT